MILCVALFVIAFVLGIIFKKSKICTAYIYIIMVILAAYRTSSADFSNYILEYNNINLGISGGRYIGFASVEYFFSKILNMSFENYLVVFYGLAFLLLICSIGILTENINFVLSLYLVFSFGIDSIQMKSLLASVLCILSISITYKCLNFDKVNKTAGLICSAVIMIAASLIHFAMFYFILPYIFLILNYNKPNIGNKIFITTIIGLFFIYNGLLAFVVKFANKLGLLNDLHYLSSWTTKRTSFGWLLYAIIIIWIILTLLLLSRNDEKIKFLKIYTYTVAFLIPLVSINAVYFRLIRVYFILLYVYITEYKFKTKIYIKECIGYLIFLIAVIMSFMIDIYPAFENTLGALLKNNSLIR